MDDIKFRIVPKTDKEYYEAFELMWTEAGLAYEKLYLGGIGDRQRNELPNDQDFQDLLTLGVRILPHWNLKYPEGITVTIRRTGKGETLFDEVIVHAHDDRSPSNFFKIAATFQKYLGYANQMSIGDLLGPGDSLHFEAREVALTRLETTASNLLVEMERVRKKRDEELETKEKSLEAKFDRKHQELEESIRARELANEKRAAELEARSKELDDRAAKHARRQHYKEIKEKFKALSEKFELTAGTANLRNVVFGFTIGLMVLFALVAGWFLYQTFTEQNLTHIIAAIVKQVVFTSLFVTTAYFFIRWNNQWFQRHANEEFRLKRMELDIDRASWFVEMAFEWSDEKGEAIPVELVERLTHGLFSADQSEHAIEPADSLAQALLGAARFKVKLADGTEAEYDRKGIEKLIRRPPTKKREEPV